MIADRFATALLAVAAIAGVFWLGGTVAASALVPAGPAQRLERAGWGLGLGLAALATGLATGFTLAFRAPVIASLVLLGGAVWLGRRFRLPPAPHPPRAALPPWRILAGTVLAVVLVWGFAAFLLRALTEPMASNDYFAIWGLKGKTFFAEQAIPRRLFDWSSFEFSNPGYPLGLPLLYAGIGSLIGAWEDHALALIFPCWMAATSMVMYGWLRRRGASALAALAAAALLAHFGALYSAHLTGMAEIPMAFAFLLAGTAVCDAIEGTDGRADARVALATWIAAGTKNEGLFFAGTALALLALLALLRKTAGFRRTALALALPALLSAALHRLAVGSHPVRGIDLAYLARPDLFDRFLEGLAAAWRIHLSPALWPAAAVVLLIAAGRRSPHGRRLLFLAAASAGVYLALPALCPYGPVWLVTWTVGRALIALAPLLTAGVAARLAPS
ncbi:MAG: hypothetical protein ABR576_15315 [Thermoanaerobaculia bacterium]